MRWGLPGEPPLVPTPEQGRDLLRRELLDPTYHQDATVQRLLDWLRRWLLDVLDAASSTPPLSAFAAMAVGLLLLLALIWLATRARTAPQRPGHTDPLLPDPSVSAAQWRERAERAAAEGRHSEALVDAFRALVARQVERGRLDAAPGATAHEVTQALQSAYPDRAAGMSEGARLFDLVLYGDRHATATQAEFVLALDDELAGVR